MGEILGVDWGEGGGFARRGEAAPRRGRQPGFVWEQLVGVAEGGGGVGVGGEVAEDCVEQKG